VLESDAAPLGNELTGDPHRVLGPEPGDQPAGEKAGQDATQQRPPRQAARVGAASHGHVGNRSAPVCALFEVRVAALPWQES
jgi:hypothetical protein